MADLKPLWGNSPVPTPDLAGDLATARGGDPNASTAGSSAVKDYWGDAPVPDPQGSETPNPMSGLPLHPDRYQPSTTPPEPPSLQDRSPGTIDEQ